MPTLTETLAREYPEEFEIADAWRSQFEDAEVRRAMFLEADVDVGSLGARRVLGFGLTRADLFQARGEPAIPAIVVHTDRPAIVRLLPDGRVDVIGRPFLETYEISSLGRLRGQFAERVGADAESLAVIALPAPQPQLAPGDEAHCGAGRASFGARITTASSARGILTAGHAAPRVGSGAYDAHANLVGSVTATVDCDSVPGAVPTPDVATVELEGFVPDTPAPGPVASVLGTARMWDTVIAYGSVTAAHSARLVVAGTAFAGRDETVGAYGEAAITTAAISAPGDSGAPVYNQAGELVAHIVAGLPGVYSVIQDVTYQLNAFGASLR
jgi:hypothetical protein